MELVIMMGFIVLIVLLIAKAALAYMSGEPVIFNDLRKPVTEFSVISDLKDGMGFSSSVAFIIASSVALFLLASVILPRTDWAHEMGFKLKHFLRNLEEWKPKMKRNDDGYKSAKHLIKSIKMMEVISEDKKKTYNGEKRVVRKMSEILNMYLADQKAFSISMYKYEYTFKVASETISRYIASNQVETRDLIEVIDNLISIPHKEIVKSEGAKWLYRNGKYEHLVIKDMKAQRNEVDIP